MTTLNANAFEIPLADGSVQCVITSPPYWQLRDYQTAGQLGLEPTPEKYIANLVAVFREVWRVLRDDGTLWLNLGDTYSSEGKQGGQSYGKNYRSAAGGYQAVRNNRPQTGLPAKNLYGIPWRVALALQADGWWLRSDIIWHKSNCMPESVTDRPTKAHEYVFLLTKSARYFYDADAIREPAQSWGARHRANGKYHNEGPGLRPHSGLEKDTNPAGRNRRTVWTVASQPYNGVKAIRDYVGADGRSYIASPDCPIHGHLARRQIPYRLQRDAQSGCAANHNLGTDIHLAEVPGGEMVAKTSHKCMGELSESSLPQTSENTGDNKKSGGHPEPTLAEKTSPHTNHTQVSGGKQDHSLDLPPPGSSQIATEHNNQNHKMARVPETSLPYNAFAQTPGHIGHTLVQRELFAPDHDNGGSKTLANDCDDNPQTEKFDRIADKQTGAAPSLASHTPTKDYTCTCRICQVDHFATFPPKLVEPMILAGTSAKGACPGCGAAWERVSKVVDHDGTGPTWAERKASGENPKGNRKPDAGEWLGETVAPHLPSPIKQTTGWQPQCTCNAGDPIPCLVLDPFAGTSTVGQVCIQHRRSFVGLELNRAYIALAQERTSRIQVEFAL